MQIDRGVAQSQRGQLCFVFLACLIHFDEGGVSPVIQWNGSEVLKPQNQFCVIIPKKLQILNS